MPPPIPTSRLSHARGALTALAALLALVGGALAHGAATPGAAEGADPPNVVFILTDDQTTSEMAALPRVRSLIGARGATFTRAYISYPLCCPSRASLFSGEYMHNHGVRGNGGSTHGGWRRFEPHESYSLGPWLHDQGFYTGHVGKYMNGYMADGDPHLPPGWDEWYGKVGVTENAYFNYSLLEIDGPFDKPGPLDVVDYGDEPADYQTDVYRDKAVEFVEGAPSPFYLSVSFGAPHGPYVPAPRHLYALGGTRLPRLPGFNEKDIRDKPRWLRRQARGRLSRQLLQILAGERRRRLEQLLAVDEAVADLFETLEDEGLIENTYVIFASDNGFFQGEHRIPRGKYLPYESSARVPLMIFGPGIPAGRSTRELVSNLDVTRTILEVAGAPAAITSRLDGRSLLPFARNTGLRTRRPILLEADTGPGVGGGGFPAAAKAALAGKRGVKDLDQEKYATAARVKPNYAPAYRGIRTNRYLLVLYANGERELYDMKLDPAQIHNRARNRRYLRVRKWLFNRLFKLSRCKGKACRVQVAPDPKPEPKRKRRRASRR